ncbi:MAG: hypothetical protein IJR94_03020 [Synergistaceae bacterium]|nr:hypothetical protein [Synergistaceae bacterium]
MQALKNFKVLVADKVADKNFFLGNFGKFVYVILSQKIFFAYIASTVYFL